MIAATMLRLEQVFAYIVDHPGCIRHEIARDVFGGTGTKANGDPAYAEASIVVNVLRELGLIRMTIGLRYNRACDELFAEDGTIAGVMRDSLPIEHVRLSQRQLQLLIHVLDRGLELGQLGEPTRAVLEHLRAEQKRLGET